MYLNVCGMYLWERIHWLKLLALLAASISEVFYYVLDIEQHVFIKKEIELKLYQRISELQLIWFAKY